MALQWALALLLLASYNSFQDSDNFGKSLNIFSLRKHTEDSQSCSCDLANFTRIIGGESSNVSKYPWVGMVILKGRLICGGSLISNKYVMTAAHCANPLQALSYEVHFLQNQLRRQPSDKITRKIIQVTVHPSYNRKTLENDIALLKLRESVQFDERIRPVCLPTGSSVYSGKDGIVVGWGVLQEGGPLPSQLQEVTVPIITNKQCRNYGLQVTDNMICAGVRRGGKDSCQGDSGGPLHILSRSELTQVGIVSWGIGCGAAKLPGVYTKVSSYLPWIRQHTTDSCSC